jgi:hypothetical protein
VLAACNKAAGQFEEQTAKRLRKPEGGTYRVRQTRAKCTQIASRCWGTKPHESSLLVGQDLVGQTLEVIERPWKSDRFGGRRSVGKNLIGQAYFINDSRQGHKG